MIKLYRKYKELILYGIFGVLTTAVNYISYVLLAHPAHIPLAASNGTAWFLSVLFAFVTNKLWVFESKSLKLRVVIREFISFVACRLFSGILDMGIMIVFVNFLHFNDLIVKIASNIIVILINYFFSKIFIFKGKTSPQNQSAEDS